ncbi:MAG: 2-vinyl bacteriochlorophyllide hydratase [Leptothrix sp. (in: b-proteobacteria)]
MPSFRASPRHPDSAPRRAALYTPEQRVRRDATRWTLVQGVLAPIQFLAFVVSALLVLRYLVNGSGEGAATLSIVIKTALLYTIMVTGCIWEKRVFDCYLFAPAFYWEDVVSMGVIALHTLYLWGLITGAWSTRSLMWLALAAYVTYAVNATQFLLKLRAARLDHAREQQALIVRTRAPAAAHAPLASGASPA